MQKRIKLLIVEAVSERVRVIRNCLNLPASSLSFDIYQTTSMAGARAYAEQMAFDMVITSLSLPEYAPTAVYETLVTAVANAPVVLICEPDQDDIARQAVVQGAEDYLFADELAPAPLQRVVQNALDRWQLRQLSSTVDRQALQRRVEQLEIQNDELTQFNTILAHQVQGILSQIIGYGSLIEMDDGNNLSPESRLSLKRILQSAQKINNVTNELMLLSSLRRDDVAIVPVEMRRVLNEVFKRLRFQVEDHDGRIERPQQWPTALGHPAWLEEVWFNYLSNGLKYGGDPPILQLGADRQQDGMVRFWVKDNGNGISTADQQRLFKPHSRLQEPRVRGQGLGLVIVQRIVKKCGGDVGVDSKIGAGSTFWFTLPSADTDGQWAERYYG